MARTRMTINAALLIPAVIRTPPQLVRISGARLRPIQLAPQRAVRMIDHIVRGLGAGLRTRAKGATAPAEVSTSHGFSVIDKELTRC